MRIKKSSLQEDKEDKLKSNKKPFADSLEIVNYNYISS
jgi:hypothetical protein